jgi:diguanylate cyclase (GGDEF)-like protein
MESGKPRILIADDDLDGVLLLSGVLKDECAIVTAKDGIEALNRAGSAPHPDLILLDIMMPGIDGRDVLRQLKGQSFTKDIPVIFVTGKAGMDDEIRGLELGAVDYINKPYQIPAVRARVRMHLAARRQAKLVEALTLMDPLTEIANRRRYEMAIDTEWRRAQREGAPLTLIMADVDRFKLYNDRYGHAEGDEALRRVAGTLQDVIKRATDVAARYGGEEFALILPSTGKKGAHTVAWRTLRRIEELSIRHEDSANGIVSLSIGAATAHPLVGQRGEKLIAAADRALYRAKARGGNQAEFEAVKAETPDTE